MECALLKVPDLAGSSPEKLKPISVVDDGRQSFRLLHGDDSFAIPRTAFVKQVDPAEWQFIAAVPVDDVQVEFVQQLPDARQARGFNSTAPGGILPQPQPAESGKRHRPLACLLHGQHIVGDPWQSAIEVRGKRGLARP